MKRTLSIFGNPFGLALYDPDRKRVRHKGPDAERPKGTWVLRAAGGEALGRWVSAEAYTKALHQAMLEAESTAALEAL